MDSKYIKKLIDRIENTAICYEGHSDNEYFASVFLFFLN